MESYDQPLQHIEKQRHYFANKGPSSQGYGFSCGHVWMWELDHKESWALKNWCFWTVVLEKTPESPLDCKEIQPVYSEDQPWDFFGRNDAKAEAPLLWPPVQWADLQSLEGHIRNGPYPWGETNFVNKVCLVKAMVFPVVMYVCESWTIKKAECRRIDAFEVCGVGEDSWESLGLQGGPTSQF